MIPVLHGVWSAGGLVSDFEHIETITVGAGGAASLTFSSIPSTYKHLQIRGIVKMTGAGTYPGLRFNNDSSSIYKAHMIYGQGSGSPASTVAGTTDRLDWAVGDGVTTNYWGFVTDILDYASTTKYKTTRCLGGVDNNGSGQVNFASGLWQSTSATTSLVILTTSSTFAQHSTFALYGVK